ncbi:50S ribosomal protein L34, chloroplastic [Capsicum annuum]|nr:50S ribosomal protein L34, chloroplastic [Capsicum annuum]KAF3648476.1 50S ribosomal protein L34, chloroplastic [Capsicum annuum]
MACWVCSRALGNQNQQGPSASLKLNTGFSRMASLEMTAKTSTRCSASLLFSFFLFTLLPYLLCLPSPCLGIGVLVMFVVPDSTTKSRDLVVRAKKYALCQTKRNRSRKSLARTHGFRKHMKPPVVEQLFNGDVQKGRWDLCPKSSPNTGKGA